MLKIVAPNGPPGNSVPGFAYGIVAPLFVLFNDPTHNNPLTVPKGYDPTLCSVVDISVEPRDGNAAHSGRSMLRGTLISA